MKGNGGDISTTYQKIFVRTCDADAIWLLGFATGHDIKNLLLRYVKYAFS